MSSISVKGVEVITITFSMTKYCKGRQLNMAPEVVVLVRDMPFQPRVQSYQVSSIYLKGCWMYGAHYKNVSNRIHIPRE